MFNVKWSYPIKSPYISLTIAPRGLECEKKLIGSDDLGIFSNG